MVAPFYASMSEALTDLPVPQAESLEEWVWYVCDALLEDTLTDEQFSAVMTYIQSDPEAWRSYSDFFILEAMIVDYFAKQTKSAHPKMVVEMASLVC